MDIKHIGIILSIIFSIIGATLLAFSIKTKGGSGFYFGNVSPTETHIIKWLFWLGLVFMAAGSLMQLLQW